MRPSSMRTGTSTWTSRNGCIRTCRMYCSRLIRLAARSNWLATIDFPDIVRDDWPVAVTAPPLKSGDFETAAGQPARKGKHFGQLFTQDISRRPTSQYSVNLEIGKTQGSTKDTH